MFRLAACLTSGELQHARREPPQDIGLEDWCDLLGAVTYRLRQIGGSQHSSPADPRADMRDCAAALEQLHTTLPHELGWRRQSRGLAVASATPSSTTSGRRPPTRSTCRHGPCRDTTMNASSINPAAQPDTPTRPELQEWEAEGGAPADGMALPGPALSPADAALLERLGTALVGEWDRLPTALQRALYARAVACDPPGDDAALKRDVARLLHDHKSRRDTA